MSIDRFEKFYASAAAALLLAGCGGGSAQNPGSASGASCNARAKLISRASGPYLALSQAERKQGGPALTPLMGHIPHAVQRYQDQGKMDEEQQLPITVVLPLNNPAQLENDIAEMYRPGSPTFHQFLTPQEFQDKYGPTDEQVLKVQAFLQSSGLTLGSVSENRLLIHAQGPVGAINAMAHTEIHQYKDETGKTVFSPAYELQMPSDVPVQAVLGIQNVTHFHTYSKQASPKPGSSHGATGPGGGFAPSDIRTAYQLPANLNGSGQTLGLFELDGYNDSDITTYDQQFGLPNVPLQNVLVDSADGSAGGGAAEVTLDIELMSAVAPGASKILVYEGPNGDQGMIDTYAKIASDNLAKEISTSWGDAEDGTDSSLVQSENTIFQQMAAQGQTIFAAAGDSGAYDDGSTLSVDDPAAQPYMVGAGGTSLTTASNGAWQSETTWNGGSASAGGGGGGISANWTIPSWQAPVINASTTKGSTTMRNVPDVSLNAEYDTGYAIYTGGTWGVWGGTSCAAPLWAAFTALVNQQRASNGLGTLGFANPALYQIGRSSRYGSDFHDIADGSTNLYYPAVTGYDDATGWGTIIGTGLLQDLSTTPSADGSTAGGACL